MECIILAGGFGTRLQSVVNDRPKCLAPIRELPFLAYLFDYLHKGGISKVILSLGYRHELVEEWLHSFSTPLEVEIVVEEEPLGTGGGVKFALEKVTDNKALVVNGDTLFSLNIRELFKTHQESGCSVTLGLKPMYDFDRYGSVTLDGKYITAFREKQFCTNGLINGGVFVLNKEALKKMPDKFSLEQDYLVVEANKNNVGGYVEDAYFIDIGIPSDYEKAQWEIPAIN
ncbi:nucleotidyltransferase family protein [Paludibacter sp.]|uniref:nucleotidyltransferase family protein n=1 Tax=Paludibacter sp. TaxID=1898105 RepID=UPI0025FD2F4D|nr:nucleotidyltransferase family protein [Paludibacter sp.]